MFIYIRVCCVCSSRKKIRELVTRMKQAVMRGDVVGAYVHYLSPSPSPSTVEKEVEKEGEKEGERIPVLFTHAGIRPQFWNYLSTSFSTSFSTSISSSPPPPLSAEVVATYINKEVRSSVEQCINSSSSFSSFSSGCTTFSLPLFQAGEDRGGRGSECLCCAVQLKAVMCFAALCFVSFALFHELF